MSRAIVTIGTSPLIVSEPVLPDAGTNVSL
jgi:hypothetical protein